MKAAFVLNRNTNKVRRVKNLGWLLRHAADVNRILVEEVNEPTPDEDAYMAVWLSGGLEYAIYWADRKVCRDWLRRPSFRGLPLKWFGEETTC